MNTMPTPTSINGNLRGVEEARIGRAEGDTIHCIWLKTSKHVRHSYSYAEPWLVWN